MTIAGSDSGGGAGIQADLKTFAALGVYGTSALTAITAQNTVGVTSVHEIPTEIIAAQIEAVLTDIGADAVKTGMLANSAIVEVVCRQLKDFRVTALVVDPVMVAKSGDSLLHQDAVEALRTLLVPLATVVTPNIPEAEVLTGVKIVSDDDMRRGVGEYCQHGCRERGSKGRPPGWAGYRPVLRRGPLPRVYRPQDRHEKHTWHRMHLRLGGGRRAGQGSASPGGGGPGQGVRNRRHRPVIPDRPRTWSSQPLLSVLGVGFAGPRGEFQLPHRVER